MAEEEMVSNQEEELPPGVTTTNIEDEMKNSYIDYAMSVIVGRALPDVRDGLKPVHRRILYTIQEMGLAYNKPFKKSARVVGDVLGKYHPHGDMAVYDSMVRMVQDFSLRYPLIQGQGNFGSIDGDPPAAMRYTEVRMARISDELLADIEKETVDFVSNYDGSLTEPSILPSKLPNLLLNGSSGIAVGMATNIPPHNLREVIDALLVCIENPDITIEELARIIKGPDFPTGGIICGWEGIKNYFETGRGSIRVRAKLEIGEIRPGRQAIIVSELPYQVNKSSLLITMAGLVRDKKINDISDLRDESDRDGIRVVIEIKRDGNPNLVLNQLYQHTQLQVSFGVIMLALVNRKPKILNIKEILVQYLNYREEIVRRRTTFELKKAEQRAHILEGLKIALDNIDRIITVIRGSTDVKTARQQLMNEFGLSQVQAQAILDMRLHQLTGLERQKLDEEYLELIKKIAYFKDVLAHPPKVSGIIRDELLQIKKQYGDERRTAIEAAAEDLAIEDLIRKEDVVITISHAGYVKRLPVSTYKAQRRGGKGVTGMNVREEDFIEHIFITSTHSYMLFFSDLGRVYWLKVYEIPEGGRTSKGKAVINLIQLSSPTEKITAAIAVHDFEQQKDIFLMMATQKGLVKKTLLEAYSNPRRVGIIAIRLEEGDTLISVKLTDGKQEMLLATQKGLAIRFKEENVRDIGRSGKGVRGIRLGKDDEVIGMEVAGPSDCLLTATENGYGKRTKVREYRLQTRGGKGIINIKATKRNGNVVGIRRIKEEDDLMLMTTQGQVIRLSVKEISEIGRNTQGVRLVKLDEQDKLAAIAYIVKEEEVVEEE